MKNYKHKGGALTLTAPRALTPGEGFLVGAIFAVATTTAAAGSAVEAMTGGVLLLSKLTGQTWTIGQRIYWDDTNHRCDSSSAAGVLVGAAAVDATNSAVAGAVCLSGTCQSTPAPPVTSSAGFKPFNASAFNTTF